MGEWRYGSINLKLGIRLAWSPSLSYCFIPRKKAPDTHQIEGWVGPRVSLDIMERREQSLASARNRTPIPLSPSQ
jgi:hypothetical protein